MHISVSHVHMGGMFQLIRLLWKGEKSEVVTGDWQPLGGKKLWFRRSNKGEKSSLGRFCRTLNLSQLLLWIYIQLTSLCVLMRQFSPDLASKRCRRKLSSRRCWYSRHSGIMHFSTSSTSAPQMEPSAGGIFTMRSLLFIPRPQVALQTSHSPHSVTRQLLGAEPKREKQVE